MSLHNYFISNIISFFTVVNTIFFILYLKEFISGNISEPILNLTRSGIVLVLCIFLLVEFHIRHEYPKLLPIVVVNNKILKPIYFFVFYFGFLILVLKIIFFLIFPFLLLSIFHIPI